MAKTIYIDFVLIVHFLNTTKGSRNCCTGNVNMFFIICKIVCN